MNKNTQKLKRQKRIRKKIREVSSDPRLCVFRSNKSIYAQVINDKEGKTIVGASEKNVDNGKLVGTRIERAQKLGLYVAKKAIEQKITKVVFDKGSYKYHGRVKAFAQGAREGGLQF